MGWGSNSRARRAALKHGYRSGFEHKVSEQLTEQKIKFGYEDTVIEYTIPERKSKYTVDFTLPNGILVETKGRWVAADRKKHLLIKKQQPELDIRLVFQSAKSKISKGSKTTYADYCDKHGIQWAEKQIPESWINEKKFF
jgi:hypothetical protein|tara:strand:+ start:584 stop:1003 length:420 start_codon:yes stop_codon:yes gene_type:complete